MISVNVIAVFWVLLLNICLFFQKRITSVVHMASPIQDGHYWEETLLGHWGCQKSLHWFWPTDAGCHSDALNPQTLLLMSWFAARIQTKGHTSECPERARPPAFTIHGLGSLWLSWSHCLCSHWPQSKTVWQTELWLSRLRHMYLDWGTSVPAPPHFSLGRVRL